MATVIPKRKFALEEKELAVEDDQNHMIDEDKEVLYVFEHYDEAVAYLMCHGIRELSTGFPFNIKIEKLQ